MQRQVFLMGIACLVLSVAGCSESLPATVTGKITLDGSNLPEGEYVAGNVMFYPTAGGAAAFGDVKSGGIYNVTTGSTKGLQPGEYTVTASVVEMEPPPASGVYENAPGQKLLTPPRYNDREKSDIMVTVGEGKNTIDLALTTK